MARPDSASQTLWLGNTINGAVTAIDAKTGEVKGRPVLDDRKRSDTVKPLQPRQLVVDDATHTVYITGVGKESVIWVVDGTTLKLKDTIANTGTYGTGRRWMRRRNDSILTNADGELVTIDTASNKIISRKRCRMMAKSTST